MVNPQIPEGLTADYANTGVQQAIAGLQAEPDYARLATFITSLREGYLVADVTGATSKKKGARVRTIRSTTGKLVLPLFTSMDELRAAHPAPQRDAAKGAIMVAREALALITSDRFAAAEFNHASAALIILRKYVTLAVTDREITPELLESIK